MDDSESIRKWFGLPEHTGDGVDPLDEVGKAIRSLRSKGPSRPTPEPKPRADEFKPEDCAKELRFNAGYCTCKDENGRCGWCLAQQGAEAVDNRDIGCRYQLFAQGQRHTTVDGERGRPIRTILSGIFESREDAEYGIGEFFSSVTTPADADDKHYLDPDGVRIRVLRLRLKGRNGIPLYKLAQAYIGCQSGARRIEWRDDHG